MLAYSPISPVLRYYFNSNRVRVDDKLQKTHFFLFSRQERKCVALLPLLLLLIPLVLKETVSPTSGGPSSLPQSSIVVPHTKLLKNLFRFSPPPTCSIYTAVTSVVSTRGASPPAPAGFSFLRSSTLTGYSGRSPDSLLIVSPCSASTIWLAAASTSVSGL